ncbi:MAG: hypothetical protein PHI91_03720 [Candidatus Pacebacteria bacterium]|nr:hypothetical protein [Candidatus Paceibacterota bacterium]MDD2757451.1 hypothetical protein [Candidatus Paceibacterota bacterium]MDD3283928.1 hypothetical protein [Candidatus Paceibacterota bacterium]MDD3970267.1 hypothetical protein [Candidatus Paceibacterota bacterium]MDD4737789.1 hypothetical protein [Candidatus Paceibacterota bacterium]
MEKKAKLIMYVFAFIVFLTFSASWLLYENQEVTVKIEGINESIFVNSFDEWLVEQQKDIFILKIENFENFNSLKVENQNAWFSYKEESRTKELIDTFTVYQWFYWQSPEYVADASGNNLIIPGEKVIIFYEEDYEIGKTIINLNHGGENIIGTITNIYLILYILCIVSIGLLLVLGFFVSCAENKGSQ